MQSVCPHDCPSCCRLEVTVEDGRLTTVTGDAGHPFTQGVICGKVREYAERVHSPLRVLTPLRRTGPKGAGRFEPVSWDDALEEIVRRWRAVIGEHGAEAILPFSYAGSMGQIQYWAGHPFFHALGASRLDRSICVATAYAGWRATLGVVTGNDSEQMVGADLVVLWGINASYTTVNVMTLVKQARARWPELFNLTRTLDKRAGALLNSACDIIEVNEAQGRITFGFRHAALAQKLATGDGGANLNALTQAVQQVFGKPYTVACRHEPSVVDRQKAASGPRGPLVREALEAGAYRTAVTGVVTFPTFASGEERQSVAYRSSAHGKPPNSAWIRSW